MPDDELAGSLRQGCQWIAEALTDVAGAMETAASGGSLHEVALSLHRIGAALERQAGALERQAAAMEAAPERRRQTDREGTERDG